ncbi:MAG: zinc-binding dehydrogenase [Furfurilactobacillus sp.]|jgi:alcohol dehydrogenase|uniref:Zinc-binding dehydrogenase n=1 Tax=Furfurilactobacillus milii TaxID=2888272 RepID=A0ABT6D7W6_9LACO|nr:MULTISPECIES: zinc-binding dehydrogenase [Furfurilactobacillus]QLE65823.1 Alcohol dehydrogenase [Furfurilactobacillus rossiae]MCF6160268.1 zinc-binding dehydrogenase [Furfurilactobacillus milii]MCF6162211.1 zinc-binding dehydrogenase [Furfurilactobacillus milii]MCF6420446.1 zinc-binding dehydrogenase [Furfurilactobacillus milii]MCH4012344.1 zinc-binding dehydrogenase [Furfurilactobacillus sp.]
MKSTVFVKAGKVEVKDIEKPTVQASDDVIIRVVRTCVCGSDLWAYRGLEDKAANSENTGHEAIGVVEEVGSAITTVVPGDFVIAPFTHGCGHCAACRAGFDGDCQDHDNNFSDGVQAEYIRFAHGEWALVKVPGKPEDYSEAMLDSLLTLADVMATGYHAARVANVHAGSTVVVVGDGAVGLCGVIAAQMRGAKRIIAMSRHEDRQKLAKEFGATDIVAERGDDAVKKVMELTNNDGADAVLECVGTELSNETATQVARPGAIVGRVGLPHEPKMDMAPSFYNNISIAGGPASVTTYDKSVLLKAVLDGDIHPGKVFTKSFKLDDIDDAYKAMANREAIKSLVVTD